MSDLISRSELLKEVEKYKFGAISNDAEREYIKKTILDFIVCQPTAYGIDKVAEKLKYDVYKKAIDDFIYACDKKCGFYSGINKQLTRDMLLEIAEQLKAGAGNGTDNQ